MIMTHLRHPVAFHDAATLRRIVLLIFISHAVVYSQVSVPKAIQYVSPVPQSINNSQQTNIIVRLQDALRHGTSIDPSTLNIHGSASGLHAGRLLLSDDDRTLVFTPTVSFAPNENVTVTVTLSGLSVVKTTDASWSFDFATSGLSPSDQEAIVQNTPPSDLPRRVLPAGNYSSVAKQPAFFESVPDSLPSPRILVSNSPSDGAIYFASWKVNIGFNSLTILPSIQQFLMIVDNNGKSLFYKKVGQTTDFKLLSNGTLSYFDFSAGKFFVMDSNFTTIDSVRCGNGYKTDPHDIRVLSSGHMLLIGLDPQIVNMSTIVTGGKTNATVTGIVVQELDQQKNVVFQWRTFDHFLITDATHEDLTAAVIDYVHSNAIDYDADGNILLSNRHMDEITKINRSTGDIIWRWGGKNNQFTFINDTLGFSHQHDIDLTSTGTYTIFDNGNFHVPAFSRVLEYSLDQQTKTATLIWQFRHTPDTYSFATGSAQRLPNGNTLIGWGADYLSATEVRPDGSTAYEITYGDSLMSYRAFRFPWPATSKTTNVAADPVTPSQFVLDQNYPNPFNPSTTIRYEIPVQGYVTLQVYDMLGREVATLVKGTQESGKHTVQFNGSRASSGLYLYKLAAGSFVQIRKMMLVK